jgi:DNA-binding transcriptional regulator YdaS (Cro superfamily)
MKMEIAVEFFGSKSEIARAIGVKPVTVVSWGDTVPYLRRGQVRAAMKAHKGEFNEEVALERVRESIEREAARKLKAVDRMISSIKEGQDNE